MSTRDEIEEINESYKDSVGNKIGHNMELIYDCSGGKELYFLQTGLLPQCGPLIFINEDPINETTGLTITFTYEVAYVSGWATGYMYNGEVRYYYKVYTGYQGTHTTGVITYPSGTRAFKQILYTGEDYIREVTSISYTSSDYDWKCYCLADDGARIVAGWNTEKERELFAALEDGHYIAPPICTICTGNHYQDTNKTICTNCGGYGYVGYNAYDYILTNRMKDFGVKQRDENLTSAQYRAWAKRVMLVPTESEVKRYVAHFLRILDTGLMYIEKHTTPDAVWTIRVPLWTTNSGQYVGTILSESGTTYQELVDDISPAGISARIEPFYGIVEDDSVDPYETDYFSGAAFLPSNISIMRPQLWWGFEWGTEWGIDNGHLDKYFQENSGIIFIAGTGFWSGGIYTGWDGDFFKGVYANQYSGYRIYDSPWSGLGHIVV
jgi:hypothetical protein